MSATTAMSILQEESVKSFNRLLDELFEKLMTAFPAYELPLRTAHNKALTARAIDPSCGVAMFGVLCNDEIGALIDKQDAAALFEKASDWFLPSSMQRAFLDSSLQTRGAVWEYIGSLKALATTFKPEQRSLVCEAMKGLDISNPGMTAVDFAYGIASNMGLDGEALGSVDDAYIDQAISAVPPDLVRQLCGQDIDMKKLSSFVKSSMADLKARMPPKAAVARLEE